MLEFTNQHLAGMIPEFFSENDPRPAKDQLHERYAHGGGVHPFKGFKLIHKLDRLGGKDPGHYCLQYPEDPPMRERCRAKLRDETLVLFDSDWFAIVQKDGTFLACRVD